ncbi:hypothetical protein GQ43DRAFT_390710 [Delitschia confertaspora ATCC 74209]|uniref:Serine hydrolase domain-containing protein n=1 Tax=Delitschia confertaspora ATCC 74209 TaxID=1513339 RepID=A0A9P4JQ48_9PLEO|nr:hypothetical protein GQ43DRAFT_390710 [Delitschia confertaspora ATCC 74209]
MKILALHGLGSSAAILEEQLSPLASHLGHNYHFTFLDGPILCGKGPGVPNSASGPFYSHTTGFTATEIREALDRIHTFVQMYGPFEGIFGFSLGASIAVSYILEYQQRGYPNPFSFAALFSTTAIFSPDDRLEQVIQPLFREDCTKFEYPTPQGGIFSFESYLEQNPERDFTEYLQVVLLSMQSMGVHGILPDRDLNSTQSESLPRLIHPQLFQDRVRIPTVHVTGQREPESIKVQSRVARALCDTSWVRTYIHEGGHHVPFNISDVRAIGEIIREAGEQERPAKGL